MARENNASVTMSFAAAAVGSKISTAYSKYRAAAAFPKPHTVAVTYFSGSQPHVVFLICGDRKPQPPYGDSLVGRAVVSKSSDPGSKPKRCASALW